MLDNTGSMEFYYWASSYSSIAAWGGTAIPTGTLDVYGFLTQSGSYGPELTPLAIVQVPEPSTILLVGAALAGLLAIRRRRVS
jgi:hypothetical protein